MLTNADKGGRGVSQMLTNAVADKGGGMSPYSQYIQH